MMLTKSTPTKGKSYKLNDPFYAKILTKQTLIDAQTDAVTYHLVLDVAHSEMTYLEGQAIGVVPPGKTITGRPNKPRLYSLANSRFGEQNNPNHLAITVKRSVYEDPNGQVHYGLCSNYICQAQVGDTLPVLSPTGRLMLLPENLTGVDLVFIATGTGVAPIRGYVEYLKNTNFTGRVFLYLGFKNVAEALYCNALNQDLSAAKTNFSYHINIALSREQTNAQGEKRYVGDLLLQDSSLWQEWLSKSNVAVYMCGLKGMEQNVMNAMNTIAHDCGVHWPEKLQEWKAENRWNVEVY